MEMVEIWLAMAICLQLSFLALSDPAGFVNIDCGIESNSHYVDNYTSLTFVSDDQYINTGVNYNVANMYTQNDVKYIHLNTLRSFPNNTRSCYTIKSVTKGLRYLVRASFFYGNYDGLNKQPIFDLYFGVSFWSVVGQQNIDYDYFEIIAIAPSDYIQVCLVNTGHGTPFISTLELRPLSSTLYTLAHSKQFLNLLARGDTGAITSSLIRYPVDAHDRLWNGKTPTDWMPISTNTSVQSNNLDIPALLLQTAAVPSSSNDTAEIILKYLEMNNKTQDAVNLYVGLHFAEFQVKKNSTDIRMFHVYVNEIYQDTVTPNYFIQTYIEITEKSSNVFNLTLERTPSSTLPPILNAYEISQIVPVISVPTADKDVTAINSIKENYDIDKDNWNGDPCVPLSLRWEDLNCSNDSSVSSRITAMNLSYSRLTGPIIASFGNLTELRKLNLSHNNLSGRLPISLDQLTSLESLDLSSNSNLDGELPSGLMKRLNDKQLRLNYNGTGIVISPDDKHNKFVKYVIIAIVATIIVLLIGGAIKLFFLYQKKQKKLGINPQPSNDEKKHNKIGDRGKRSSFCRRQFSFEELKLITNNFSDQIGLGGFGKVFKGCLEDGMEVAVKLHSGLSSQGVREFLNEIESLSKIHHKNLVSLLGYCDDGDNIALIYEYMQYGNLQDWLRGNAGPLNWKQRLQIAYESAQGLEYLHKMCKPPLIHRDVKATNILLTTNLEAKISDFGLVRALEDTHVSTKVVGTLGYLDPFYALSWQLTEKSDVYSFGVVLLEIITGLSPILDDPLKAQMGEHLTRFVHQKISTGNIESVLDLKIGDQYNVNSVWKVAGLALRCTDEPARRPDMTAVVTELKEILDLENCSTGTTNMASVSISLSTDNHSRNENPLSDIEIVAHMPGLQVPDAGPSAR